MLGVARLQSTIQRDDCQRHDHDRENHMRNQNGKIDRARPALAEKANVSRLVVKEQIAAKKYRRGGHGRDHARPVRGHPPLRNQNAPREQQHSAASVESGVQGREVGVLFSNQAAGLILRDYFGEFRVRRFTIRNASPNMTNENRISVAMADGSGNVVSAPGYKSARSASTP